MIINDDCYGSVEITEEELIAIPSLPEMKRLKCVGQHGWTDIIHPELFVSRFEHTIGAGLLTRILRGSLEEQAAAFFHDISHTAFSHAADYLYSPETDASFHEKELPTFFRLHAESMGKKPPNCPWDYFKLADHSRYHLLEQAAPALCTDRLDYLFRDAFVLDLIDAEDISTLIGGVCVEGGRLICRDLETAAALSELYDEADRLLWRKTDYLGYNAFGASIVKTCLESGILEYKDLWSTDEQLIAGMFAGGNENVTNRLKILLNRPAFIVDEIDYDLIIKSRIRYIDPEVVINRKCVHASSLSENCRKIKEKAEAHARVNIPLRII